MTSSRHHSVVCSTILFTIFTSIVIGRARKFFLSLEKRTTRRTFFMLFVFFLPSFLCCLRRSWGEWIWVYALRDLLKHRHRTRRWGRKRKRKKLQKIAHRPARYTARNMLISAVIRMFCGIMLVILQRRTELGMLFSLFSLLAIPYILISTGFLSQHIISASIQHRNSWRVRLICFITLLFMCSNACFRFYIVPLSKWAFPPVSFCTRSFWWHDSA